MPVYINYVVHISHVPVTLFQVLCQGQIIGGIVAKTQEQAQAAADNVRIDYEELKPIVTIKVHVYTNSYHFKTGNTDYQV